MVATHGTSKMADLPGIPVVDTPVLIIGSSMVGMTLSSLLAKQYKIPGCTTIEKHASTAIHPRAALFHPRTMQIYRELGLYEQMKEESGRHYDQHAGLYNVETLADGIRGKDVQTFMQNINEGLDGISPTSRLFLTQQMFEPLLRKHAIDHGANLQFSSELLDFQQDDAGVTALVRNTETGAKQLVRAKYMIACDGNRSFVRRKLGIKIQGHGLLSRSITIYFKANLSRFVQGRYNGVIYVNNDLVRGFFRLDKTGTEGFLVVNTYGPRGEESSRYPSDGITDEKASEILRAAIGADVEFDITLLSPWDAVCDVAQSFSSGRILLAGDAAHTVTPHGGFGGNTGIQDAHNLAWKLALVLNDKAGRELVEETYHAERFPVGKKTVDQVFARYIARTAPELKTAETVMEDEVPEPWLELGYRYHSRALTSQDIDPAVEDPRTAKARPGSLARHVFISTENHHNKPQPIADFLGHDFVFIAGHEAIGWVRAMRSLVAEESWLPSIDVHRLSITQGEENSAFYDQYDISPSGCVLIRPDGFVAWSERHPAVRGMAGIGMPGPEETLKCVMLQLLCLSAAPSSAATSDSESKTPAMSSSQRSTNTEGSMSTSLAPSLHAQVKSLEQRKEGLLASVAEIDKKLADLKRMDELQNEMAMLKMKIDMDGTFS